jgi:hypothetical protein
LTSKLSRLTAWQQRVSFSPNTIEQVRLPRP